MNKSWFWKEVIFGVRTYLNYSDIRNRIFSYYCKVNYRMANYCCNYWTECTSRTILYKSHALALDICKHLKCNFCEFMSWTLFLVQLLHTVSIHNSKGRKNTLSAANVLPFLTNTEQYCIFLLNTIMLIAQG